jgi:hypothetical protein
VSAQGGSRRYLFGLRVTCPKCGAGKGTNCPTPDGAHHPERMAAFDHSRVVAARLGFPDPCWRDGDPDAVLAAVHNGESPSTSLRAEIVQILIDHPRTRYAKVLLGIQRGFTDAEMAEEAIQVGEPINAESIAHVRKLVRLSLDDELVSAPSDAAGQAGLYRELLNYRRSPELTQHINTKLAKLRELDPKIPLTPLGHVHLGANDPLKPEKPERVCPDCFMVHAGECP